MLNRNRVAGKDIGENKRLCDTLDVTEDFFCEEELVILIKRLNNNKIPVADSMVNDFLKSSGTEVRNKVLKVMKFDF